MEPLAYRMKPQTLEDFFGQEEIVGKDKLLYRLIKADKLTSAIFWGPPGCGKTSLARIIAKTTKNKFVTLNATTSGVSDIKAVVDKAQNIFENPTGKVILFIDEIHRFNKLQQDALLPHVEKGTVILIGATTENPFFSVNKALLSRSTIFKFKELQSEDVIKVLNKCISDKEESIKEISKVYYDNKLRGNKEYFGKKIKVTAQITSINSDSSVLFNTGVTVNLEEKGAYYYMMCNFKDGDSTGILNYNRGDMITIIGTMDELIGNSLCLKKCIIVK